MLVIIIRLLAMYLGIPATVAVAIAKPAQTAAQDVHFITETFFIVFRTPHGKILLVVVRGTLYIVVIVHLSRFSYSYLTKT